VRFPRATHRNIYVSSERSGQRVMASVTRFIEGRLRLKVNQNKSAVAEPNGRHFVGFRLKVRPLAEDVEVRLSKRTIDRAYDKIRELIPRGYGNTLTSCIERVNEYLVGWINFFGICAEGEHHTLVNLEGHVRRRLRGLLLKQWKRKSFIARRLLRLGTGKGAVRAGIFRGHRSWWALSNAPCVTYGLSNAYFAKRGLVSVVHEWRKLRTKRDIATAQLTLAL